MQEQGKLGVLFSSKTIENTKDLIGCIAKNTGTSRSEASKLLKAKPLLLIDDIDLSQPADVELLNVIAAAGIRVIAASRELRVKQLTSVAAELDTLPNYLKLDLQPVPLKQIAELGKQLEKSVALPNTGSYLRKIIVESFDAALPRQPWIILIFFEALAGNQVSAGVTLAQLLLRYTAHRLATGLTHLQPATDVSSRALGWIAQEMIDELSVELEYSKAISLIEHELANSDLRISAKNMLDGLMRCGLLIQRDIHVSFSFPAFQEFFYAVHLAARPRTDDIEIDAENLPRLGGALGPAYKLVDRVIGRRRSRGST